MRSMFAALVAAVLLAACGAPLPPVAHQPTRIVSAHNICNPADGDCPTPVVTDPPAPTPSPTPFPTAPTCPPQGCVFP